MKMTKYISIIVIGLIFCQCAVGQGSLNKFIKSLNNNSLKYELIVHGPKFSDSSLQVSKYSISIKSIDLEATLRKFGEDRVLSALINNLDNPSSDWYSNVLLYAVTKKDATLFTIVDSRDQWLKSGNKTIDLNYWRNLSKIAAPPK